MNTANLQLKGVLLALYALLNSSRFARSNRRGQRLLRIDTSFSQVSECIVDKLVDLSFGHQMR